MRTAPATTCRGGGLHPFARARGVPGGVRDEISRRNRAAALAFRGTHPVHFKESLRQKSAMLFAVVLAPRRVSRAEIRPETFRRRAAKNKCGGTVVPV